MEGKEFNYVTYSLVVPQGVAGIQMSTVILRELLWAQQSPDTEDLPLPLLQHPLLAASLLVPIQVYRKIHFAQNKLSKISALLGLGLPHGKTHSFTQLSVDQSFLPQIASHFTDLRRPCSSSSVPQMAGRSTYQPLT